MQHMRDRKHPALMQMYTYYDYDKYRVFVLPWYEGDLSQLLAGKFNVQDINPPPTAYTLKHGELGPPPGYCFWARSWLWLGILQVLEGLQEFHNRDSRGTSDQGAHLDMKPQNILIGRHGNLVISDCGNSKVRPGSSLTTCHLGWATEQYKPPPTEWDAANEVWISKVNQSFDVWSMACIMLQVLVFLLQGPEGVEQFSGERYMELKDGNKAASNIVKGDRSYCFWSKPNSKHALKSSVSGWLQLAESLSKATQDDALLVLTTRLRIMFQISPDERGTIRDCLEDLRGSRESKNVKTPLNFRPFGLDEGGRIEGVVNSLYVNIDLAQKAHEIGYVDPTYRPETLWTLSKMYSFSSVIYFMCNSQVANIICTIRPLTLVQGGQEHPCRIKLFEDDTSGVISLTTTYIVGGQVVCQVEKCKPTFRAVVVRRHKWG